MTDLNLVGNLTGGLGGMLGLLSNPIIMLLFGLVLAFSIIIYMYSRSHPNCPFIMASIQFRYFGKYNKRQFKPVRVLYIKLTENDSIFIDRSARELRSHQGLYCEWLDQVQDVPSTYFIPGSNDDDVLFFRMASKDSGYPISISMIDLDKIKTFEELTDEEKIELGITKPAEELSEDEIKRLNLPYSDKSIDKKSKVIIPNKTLNFVKSCTARHNLFLGQNFANMIHRSTNIVREGKSGMHRLMEQGAPVIIFIALMFMFILTYTVGTDLVSQAIEYNKQNQNIVIENYKLMGERDKYCQILINKYGSNSEKEYYNNLPSPLTT